MGKVLPPKRLAFSQLQAMPTQLLVAHLATHERYARLNLTTQAQHDDYQCYIKPIYRIGENKQGFDQAVAVARINQIPFKYKLKKGRERVRQIGDTFVYEKVQHEPTIR